MAEVFDLMGNKIGSGEDAAEEAQEVLSPTKYKVTMKNGWEFEVTGFLLVNPLFVGISDSKNKIIKMFSNSEYALIEAVEQEAQS